jgi:hypothetical protein
MCQPIDMGINKPIKVTDEEGIIDGVAKEPTQKMVAQWLVEVYSTMPEVIGRSTWMRGSSGF